MSSKINRYRQPARKSPTALAPKKCLSKSVVLENANKSPNDVPVIIIDSSSESSLSSSDSGNTLPRMQSPIVVSDSDDSNVETPLNVVEKNRVMIDSLSTDNDIRQEEKVIDDSRRTNPYENANQKIPNTEWRDKKISTVTHKEENNNNLSKILHKTGFKTTSESYWKQLLLSVFDPDTDLDSENRRKFEPARFNFEDRDDEGKKKNSWNTELSNRAVSSEAVNRGKENYNPNKGPSFLASLSGSVLESKCDVSALIFRTNFKQNRKALTNKLFQLYNDKVFDNRIPKETPLEWSRRMKCTSGYCQPRKITRRTGAIERAVRIVLSSKVLNSADRVRDTLIHEMCHAATWIIDKKNDGHGSYWQRWTNRARRVFPELPPIQRYHQYAIKKKYTYKCVQCGYSFRRHTRSFNTKKKRCGHCLGTVELLINKNTRKDEQKGQRITLVQKAAVPKNLETTSRILTATNKSLNVPPAKKFKSSI